MKVIYGRLDQSSYSPVTGAKFYESRLEPGRIRFASGIVATFQPRGVDGLEVGAARFFHSIWPRSGIPRSYITKPLEAFLKSNLSRDIDFQVGGTDNQLASVFARWAFTGSGLEVYGEYGREDHGHDRRDLVQEPDHQRAYSLGLSKIIGSSAGGFNVLRAELIGFQMPSIARTGRGEGDIYIHTIIRQGHTNRGQLLGANVGVGAAAGSTVAWNHYSRNGRWALFWRRNVRGESGDFVATGDSNLRTIDVSHAVGFERLRFTRKVDITTAVTVMRDFNRNFVKSVSNANLAVAVSLPR